MKIVIIDGNRHLKSTGYGQLSRSIILSLKRHTNHEIFVEKRHSYFEKGIKNVDEINEVKEISFPYEGCDIALFVTPPKKPSTLKIPKIIYTQNALGDLPSDWIECLSYYEGIIVPGEFDKRVFSKYFENVSICPQVVDHTNFKPVARWRGEGPSEENGISFLFVGSYSYRKGVDLLIPSFKKSLKHLKSDINISLTMHCFSGLEGKGINQLISSARDLPNNIGLQIFNGSISPEWMNRTYNQHDAVISLSRGEGWCMPLHEALLCGKPVIFPDSTAMGEYLPSEELGSYRVSVREKSISSIKTEFGLSIKNRYEKKGNFLWEPNTEEAAIKIANLVTNYESNYAKSKKAREWIIKKYNYETMAKKLSESLEKLLNYK